MYFFSQANNRGDIYSNSTYFLHSVKLRCVEAISQLCNLEYCAMLQLPKLIPSWAAAFIHVVTESISLSRVLENTSTSASGLWSLSDI